MNEHGLQLGLEHWTRDARCEPCIRIGVILREDRQRSVRLDISGSKYCLQAAGDAGLMLEPGQCLRVSLGDQTLAFTLRNEEPRDAKKLRLTPMPGAAGSSASGVRVSDVVAGRGFHWQQRIRPTLPGTIELRPADEGLVLINELRLEDYLTGVITAEMSAACPLEFLKAQCIVARSWLLAMSESKHADEPFDRCNDDCCQRYQGIDTVSPDVASAVRTTRGRVLLDPGGGVLDANYSKSCGGISEEPRFVWGAAKPGFSAVVDAPRGAAEARFFPITEANVDEYMRGAWLPTASAYCSPHVVAPSVIGKYLGGVDTAGDYFRWTVRFARRDLEALLRERLPDAGELDELTDLRVTARGVSGRAAALEIIGANTSGGAFRGVIEGEYRIRHALHRKFLYSSAFVIDHEHDSAGRLESVTLHGAGWGHGAGFCQIGALGMALYGIDCDSICRHYFPKATTASVYA